MKPRLSLALLIALLGASAAVASPVDVLRALQRALYAEDRAAGDRTLLQARITDTRAALLEFRQNVFSARVRRFTSLIEQRNLRTRGPRAWKGRCPSDESGMMPSVVASRRTGATGPRSRSYISAAASSEVRAIRRIYGERNSRVYVGDDARESVLKREAPRHDVLLEAREIAELELDADLAVLSACETGKAEELNGDGVIGLSWALLAAGARTTVVSQWKAQSAATATLMIELHRRLARGMSKAQALREAQLAVRAQRAYRHPFYWAPFVVIGAP
ncbi:MAG TPA: CHAT domain-containing protein [Thermoanaerobaculia bacterium]|nr:CHAT domain-containing protein [Thermoanaerobaculia bacterium]